MAPMAKMPSMFVAQRLSMQIYPAVSRAICQRKSLVSGSTPIRIRTASVSKVAVLSQRHPSLASNHRQRRLRCAINELDDKSADYKEC